jgi:hypothetical protein
MGAGSASAQRVIQDQNGVTSVGGFVEMWQQRINNENLPVADAKSWGIRNLPRISAFSAERFRLAQQVTNFGELDAMLVSAPVSDGSSLGMLMANAPGNVSLAAGPKLSPTTNPTTYSDLLFTALSPCRLYDSRVSQGGAGPWVANVVRNVKIGPYPASGGGYATGGGAQGGSATGCGLDALSTATGQIAATMLAVSTVAQTAAGYLTFWPFLAPDPSASVVSLWYQPGYVQTSFIVAPSDADTVVWTSGVAKGANTEVIIDIVGYYAKVKTDMWAVVDSTGATVRGYRNTSSTRIAVGAYEAVFSQDVTGCVYNATVGGTGNPPHGTIIVAPRGGNPNGVFVETRNVAGALTDLGFHVRVKCT